MTDYSGQLGEIIKMLTQIKGALSQNSFNLFSAVAATASFVAACAGLWAASSAFRAARNAQTIARLGMLRNLIQVGYDVISEVDQVRSIVEDIKMQIKDLAISTGRASGPMVDKIVGEAESKRNKIVPIQEEAQRLIVEHATLKKKSEQDLAENLSRFDGFLSEVRRVRSRLEQEAESYAAQNRIYQADAASKSN